MRLLLFTSSYPLRADDSEAAAGLFVRDLALELVDQGHAVHVVTQARRGPVEADPGVRVTRYAWLGAQPLSTLRLTRPRGLAGIGSVVAAGLAAAEQVARRERPELALALWALPSGVFSLYLKRRFGIPYVAWTLGSDVWSYGKVPVARSLLKSVLRGAEAIFADGHALANDTAEIAGRTCEFLPSARRLPRGTQRPHELVETHKNFVFIGRFHQNKGVDQLIEAVALLEPSERQSIRLFLFGGGPLEDQVRSRISQQGLEATVRLMGYADRSRAAAFLEHCDACVIPSRIESIPVILSDAAAARCPILATRVGDMGKIIDEYAAGIAVESRPAALRDGISRMLSVSRAEHATALARLANDFSIARSARRLVERLPREGTEGPG